MAKGNYCDACGYDLRASTGDSLCPECGTPTGLSRQYGYAHQVCIHRGLVVAALAMAFLAAVVLGVRAFSVLWTFRRAEVMVSLFPLMSPSAGMANSIALFAIFVSSWLLTSRRLFVDSLPAWAVQLRLASTCIAVGSLVAASSQLLRYVWTFALVAAAVWVWFSFWPPLNRIHVAPSGARLQILLGFGVLMLGMLRFAGIAAAIRTAASLGLDLPAAGTAVLYVNRWQLLPLLQCSYELVLFVMSVFHAVILARLIGIVARRG